MSENTGYFAFRLGAIAAEQGLNWKTLAAKTAQVDPDGLGLKPKTVSEHLNLEWCDRIEGKTAWLYCNALGCEFEELYVLRDNPCS